MYEYFMTFQTDMGTITRLLRSKKELSISDAKELYNAYCTINGYKLNIFVEKAIPNHILYKECVKYNCVDTVGVPGGIDNLYKEVATAYAEKYGIIEYTVKGDMMTWYANVRNTKIVNGKSVPAPYTIKRQLNLQNLALCQTALQRLNKKGWHNS